MKTETLHAPHGREVIEEGIVEKQTTIFGGTVPTPVEAPKKQNRHVIVALRHMNQRRAALLEKRAQLTKEIEELDTAILALG